MSQHAATDLLIELAVQSMTGLNFNDRRSILEACLEVNSCPHVKTELLRIQQKIETLENDFLNFSTEDCRLSV